MGRNIPVDSGGPLVSQVGQIQSVEEKVWPSGLGIQKFMLYVSKAS